MTRINWKAISWAKEQQLELPTKEEALIKIRDEILNSTPEELLHKIMKTENTTMQDFLKEFQNEE